jgi:hypothetical protein
MCFPFGFLGNYLIERGVVVSFTSYIILFKLLNWRRVGLQKIYGSACSQDTWSYGDFKGSDEILSVVPT